MKNLQRILCMPDKELGSYLISKLKKYYKNIETDRDNYIYAVGTGEVCLVAHIDTVRAKIHEPVMLSVQRNVIRNVKGILGADDRAGVYGILEVIKTCASQNTPLPSVLFTNYEEHGGRGVKKFIASKKFQSENIKLLVELDRKGCNEYVFYSLTLPKPIKDYIESFGFKEERGSYSDISDLTAEYLIPSVNLSVGYYSQHTSNEKLHYDELLMTIDRVVDICCDPPTKLHPVAKAVYGNWKGGGYKGGTHSLGDTYGDDWEGYYAFNTAANRQHEAAKTPVVAAPATTTVSIAATCGNKSTTKTMQDIDNIIVSNIIINQKADIKSELTTVYTLDTIAQKYLNHNLVLLIVEKLGEIEDSFYQQSTVGSTGAAAFEKVWEEMLTSSFYKTNPRVAAMNHSANK